MSNLLSGQAESYQETMRDVPIVSSLASLTPIAHSAAGQSAPPAPVPLPLFSPGPIVRIESTWLIRPLEHDNSPFRWIRFRQQILWIRECEARVFLLRDGFAPAEHARHTDLHEFMGCVGSFDDAVTEAKHFAAANGINLKSEAEVVVMLGANDIPCLIDPSAPPPQLGSKRVRRRRLHPEWRYADPALLSRLAASQSERERHRLEALLPQINVHEALPETLVWSSRRDESINIRLLVQAKENINAATVPLSLEACAG